MINVNRGVIPLAGRKFGGGMIDTVPSRGLIRYGPYFTPSEARREGLYIYPVVIKTPGFDIDKEQVLSFANNISSSFIDYFKVPIKILDYSEVSFLSVQDFTPASIGRLVKDLENIFSELKTYYEKNLDKVIVIIFTKQTSREFKLSPYYATKLVFQDTVATQVITEKVLQQENPQYSIANIALGMFTKIGGIPWRLSEALPSADVVIGVGRTEIKLYNSSQSGIFRRGLIGSLSVLRSDGVLTELRATTMEDYKELATWTARNASSVVTGLIRDIVDEINVSIHYSGKKPRAEEIDAINKEIGRVREKFKVKVNAKIVHITDEIPHRLLSEEFKMYPERGLYWVMSPKEALITPLGAHKEGDKTHYPFTGIPRTLKLTLYDLTGSPNSQEGLMQALHEAYYLTFMHLAGLHINVNEPISTKYSRQLAYLVLSLKILSEKIGLLLSPESEFKRLWFL